MSIFKELEKASEEYKNLSVSRKPLILVKRRLPSDNNE